MHLDFVQTRVLAALSRPLKASGSMVLARGQGGDLGPAAGPLAITYAMGPGGLLVVDADGHRERKSARDAPLVAQVGRVFQALAQGDWTALDSLFTVTGGGTPQRWQMELLPRPQAQSFVGDPPGRGPFHRPGAGGGGARRRSPHGTDLLQPARGPAPEPGRSGPAGPAAGAGLTRCARGPGCGSRSWPPWPGWAPCACTAAGRCRPISWPCCRAPSATRWPRRPSAPWPRPPENGRCSWWARPGGTRPRPRPWPSRPPWSVPAPSPR